MAKSYIAQPKTSRLRTPSLSAAWVSSKRCSASRGCVCKVLRSADSPFAGLAFSYFQSSENNLKVEKMLPVFENRFSLDLGWYGPNDGAGLIGAVVGAAVGATVGAAARDRPIRVAAILRMVILPRPSWPSSPDRRRRA